MKRLPLTIALLAVSFIACAQDGIKQQNPTTLPDSQEQKEATPDKKDVVDENASASFNMPEAILPSLIGIGGVLIGLASGYVNSWIQSIREKEKSKRLSNKS